MEYSVIFSGVIHEDFSRKQVRQNLATLFRTDDTDRLDRLLSGSPVVLKKGLTEAEAARYQQTLLRAGAVCELRSAGAAELPQPVAPAAVVAPAAFLLEDPMLPAVPPPAPAVPASAFASLSGLNLGMLDDALAEPEAVADSLEAPLATPFVQPLPPVAAPPAPAEPPAAAPVKRDFSAALAGITLAPIEPHGEDSKASAPPPPRPAPAAAPARPDFGSSLAGISLVPIEEAPAAAAAPAPVAAVIAAAGTASKLAVAPPPPPGVATVEAPKSAAASLSPILREQLAADAAGIRSTFGAGSGEMPEEAKGLCWAGFLLPWLWLRKHSAWYIFPLLIILRFTYRLIPWPIWAVIYLSAIVFLLFKGREMAWNSRSWSSVETFNQHQKLWTAAGVVLAVVQVFFLYNIVTRSVEASANPRVSPETAAIREEIAREQAEEAARMRNQAPPEPVHQELSVSSEAYLNSFKDPAEREQKRRQLQAAADRDAAEHSAANGGANVSGATDSE